MGRATLAAVVSGTAFCVLGLELLLARVFPFMLGDVSAFLTIPVAMFGLALGALFLHWTPDAADPDRALRRASGAFAAAVVLGLLAIFALFNGPLGLVHHGDQDPSSAVTRILALPGCLLPAYALAGVVLSLAFRAGADRLGRLYALDLAGSALACAAAPVLLRLAGMEITLGLVAAAAVAVAAVCAPRPAAPTSGPLRAALAVAAIGLVVAAAAELVFTARPSAHVLGNPLGRPGQTIEGQASAWNDLSRVGVLDFVEPDGRRSVHLVHDDGISNVRLRGYRAEELDGAPPRVGRSGEGLAWLVAPDARTALVMFAGAGSNMVLLDRYFRGRLAITGVEINPLVDRLARARRGARLDDFLARDGIELVLAEGRGYLDRTDAVWDLIYVANNGALFSTRTGHSRKFLDTREAMEAYVDHLAPGGVVCFNSQDIDHKLEAFKRIHAARGGDVPFADAVLLTGRWKETRTLRRMYYRPEGFDPAVTDALRTQLPRPPKTEQKRAFLRWGPGMTDPEPAIEALVRAPIDPSIEVPTDDRPYPRRVDFAGWTPSPDRERFEDRLWTMSWIKVLTLILATLAALATFAAFQLRPRGGHRMPPGPTLWFVGTGVCYMLVQIGLMGKLDLLLGNPLSAIAVVLASFLLANAAGARWFQLRREAGPTPSAGRLALAAAALVPVTLIAVELATGATLGLPLAVKAVVGLLLPAPLAAVLGTFYPAGVAVVTDRDRAPLVPMTFGLATLSSVAGATFAMVWVINVGFRVLLATACGGYLLVGVVALGTGFGALRTR